MESYTDEFSYFPKLSERPTKYEVLTQLATIDALWRNIGNGLGVSYNVLQGLAEANMSNQTTLGHVIQRWFDMNGQDGGAPVTWTAILNVIKGPLVQNIALARKIYEYLKEQSSVQQSVEKSVEMPESTKDKGDVEMTQKRSEQEELVIDEDIEEPYSNNSTRKKKYLIVAFTIILLAAVINTVIIPINVKTDTLHIINKTVIGGSIDRVRWEDSGFTMQIFGNCFPKGKHVHILVSLGNCFPFEILIPKGYKLVSPMYKINASERLLEAVTITLKHNAIVTNSEMAEALALLHISDEGEMKLLHGRVEPNNSTYVTTVISDLSYVAVVGLDKLNQTFLVSFFRKKNDHGYSNPLLKILIVIYPFKQNKDIEEKLKSEGWIANDNMIPQDLVGNGTVHLIAEPIGCWKISESAENDTIDVKDQPVTSEMLLEYEISNCDVHKSLIKFRNTHNNKVYQTFVGDKIVTTQWENVVMFITENSLTISAFIMIILTLSFLWKHEAKKEVIQFIQIITLILILIILNNIGTDFSIADITTKVFDVIKHFLLGKQ